VVPTNVIPIVRTARLKLTVKTEQKNKRGEAIKGMPRTDGLQERRSFMVPLSRYSSIEIKKLPDCAGLLENGSCRWLQISVCIGEKCTFNKRVKSQDRAEARLCSLDEETQERIANKYYGGFRPWTTYNAKT